MTEKIKAVVKTIVSKVEIFRLENPDGSLSYIVKSADASTFDNLSATDLARSSMVSFPDSLDEVKNGGRSTHEKLGRASFQYLNREGWRTIQKEKENAKTTTK